MDVHNQEAPLLLSHTRRPRRPQGLAGYTLIRELMVHRTQRQALLNELQGIQRTPDHSHLLSPLAVEAFRIIGENDTRRPLSTLGPLQDLSLFQAQNRTGLTIFEAASAYGTVETREALLQLIADYYYRRQTDSSDQSVTLTPRTHEDGDPEEPFFYWMLFAEVLLPEYLAQAISELTLEDLSLDENEGDNILERLADLRYASPAIDAALLARTELMLAIRIEELFDELDGDQDENGNTKLHYLSALGIVDIMDIAIFNAMDDMAKAHWHSSHPVTLVEHDMSYLNHQNSLGFTPLHCAVKFDREESVAALLDRNPDLQLSLTREHEITIPASYAIQLERHTIAQRLIAKEEALPDDDAAVSFAQHTQLVRILTAAIKMDDGDAAVAVARKMGNHFISAGPIEEDDDTSQFSPLHFAASNGYAHAYRALARLNPEYPYLTTFLGDTALDLAIEHRHQDVVNACLEVLAEVTPLDENLGLENAEEIFHAFYFAHRQQEHTSMIAIFSAAQPALATPTLDFLRSADHGVAINFIHQLCMAATNKANPEQAQHLLAIVRWMREQMNTAADADDDFAQTYRARVNFINHSVIYLYLFSEQTDELETHIDEFGGFESINFANALLHIIRTDMNPTLVQYLLDHNVNPNTILTYPDETPLLEMMKEFYRLCHQQRIEEAKALLPNAKACIRILILAGADINKPDNRADLLLEEPTIIKEITDQLRKAIVDAEAEKRQRRSKKRQASEIDLPSLATHPAATFLAPATTPTPTAATAAAAAAAAAGEGYDADDEESRNAFRPVPAEEERPAGQDEKPQAEQEEYTDTEEAIPSPLKRLRSRSS